MLIRFTSIDQYTDKPLKEWTVPHTTIKGIYTAKGLASSGKVFLDINENRGCYVTLEDVKKITEALEAVTREDNLVSVN